MRFHSQNNDALSLLFLFMFKTTLLNYFLHMFFLSNVICGTLLSRIINTMLRKKEKMLISVMVIYEITI